MTTAEAKKHVDADFCWPDVVIGSDLNAVDFACKNRFHLLRNRNPHYHSYDDAEEEWAGKIYGLYTKGLVPFSDKILRMRVSEADKTVKVYSHQGVYSVNFSNIYLFDDENVEGASLDREVVNYKVVDWFDCKGVLMRQQELRGDDNFIKKIGFYLSRRIDGNKKYADIFCESWLTQQQLDSFDHSETMARFKAEQTLRSHGIDNFSLNFWKREKYPVYEEVSL